MPKSSLKPATKKKKGAEGEKEVSELGRILTKLAQANVASGAKLAARTPLARSSTSNRRPDQSGFVPRLVNGFEGSDGVFRVFNVAVPILDNDITV